MLDASQPYFPQDTPRQNHSQCFHDNDRPSHKLRCAGEGKTYGDGHATYDIEYPTGCCAPRPFFDAPRCSYAENAPFFDYDYDYNYDTTGRRCFDEQPCKEPSKLRSLAGKAKEHFRKQENRKKAVREIRNHVNGMKEVVLYTRARDPNNVLTERNVRKAMVKGVSRYAMK